MEKTLTLQVKANVMAALSAIKQLGQSFTEAFKFERAQIQFKHLIGNIDEAKRHVEALREAGKTGAFGFDELASASRTLINFSGGVLKSVQYVNMLADVSAATGIHLDTLAKNVGKFYDKLASGDDITKLVEQLQRTGTISSSLANELTTMAENGASAVEMWDKLTEAMKRFEGVNDQIANTIGGTLDKLTNSLKDAGVKGAEAFSGQLDVVGSKMDGFINKAEKISRWTGQASGRIAGSILSILGFGGGEQAASATTAVEEQIDAARNALIALEEDPIIAETKKLEAEEDAENEKHLQFVIAMLQEAEEAEEAKLALMKKQNDEFKKQQDLVKSIQQGIQQTNRALNAGYAGVMTTTGQIGGYQSLTEASFAQKMPGHDPQLDELVKQTSLLTEINRNITQAGTFG